MCLTDRGIAEVLKRCDRANPLVGLVRASAGPRKRMVGLVRNVETLHKDIDRKEKDLARDASVVDADDTYHRIGGSLHYLLLDPAASQHMLREELNRRKRDRRSKPTLVDMYLGEESAVFFDYGGIPEDYNSFGGKVAKMTHATHIHGPPLPRSGRLLTRREWLDQRLLFGDLGPDGVVRHTIGETMSIVRNSIDSHSLSQHEGRLKTEMLQGRASFGDTHIVSQMRRWLGWYWCPSCACSGWPADSNGSPWSPKDRLSGPVVPGATLALRGNRRNSRT